MPTVYNNGSGYFLYVSDISEVYNYSTPQGSTMFFMNRDQPVMYLKSVNMFNQQTVTIYDLVERKQQVPQIYSQNITTKDDLKSSVNDSEFVTRSELSALIQDAIRSEMKNNRGHKNREA